MTDELNNPNSPGSVPTGARMPALADLDSRINQLFREKEKLQALGEAGQLLPNKGWIGTSTRYAQVLAELRILTRQRIVNLNIKGDLNG